MLFDDFKHIQNPTKKQYLAVLLDDQYLKKVFKTIPKEFLDLEFCKEAIRANPKTLDLIPEEFKTRELYLVVVKTVHSLKLVPDRFKDNKFLLEAIDICPFVFGEIENKTYEMCVSALQKSPQFHDKVPMNLRSQGLILDVVKSNEFILKYISPDLINKEISEIAVRENGVMLEYVPEKYKTYDLCLMAVNQCGSALEYVPRELLNSEIINLALTKLPASLRFVPKELQAVDMCLDMMEKYPNCYSFVKICENPNFDDTKKNLQVVLNKQLVHRTIDGIK